MERNTTRERTIATRRTTTRLCTALGVAMLAAGVVFALLPGSPGSCGSLLAPMYPPAVGVTCAAAQIGWLPIVIVAVVLGLLLLGAGAALAPSRRSRRSR